MKRWLILFMVGCLALAGTASAAVQQGDTEIDFQGGWISQNSAGRPAGNTDLAGIDFDSVFVSGELGYFLTDNLQVGVVAMGSWSSTEIEQATGPSNDIDVDVYGVGGKAKYHFMPTNQLVPYIGGQILWTSADVDTSTSFRAVNRDASRFDGTTDGLLWGPVAGIRYELNAYNDFFVEYQYHIWTSDMDDVFDDGHGIFLGLIHQFK